MWRAEISGRNGHPTTLEMLYWLVWVTKPTVCLLGENSNVSFGSAMRFVIAQLIRRFTLSRQLNRAIITVTDVSTNSAIHTASRRGAPPINPVSCAADLVSLINL